MDKLTNELLIVLNFNETIIIDMIADVKLPSDAEYLLQIATELVFVDKLKTYLNNNIKYKIWRHRLSKRQNDMLEYFIGQYISCNNNDNGKLEEYFAKHDINAYY